MSVIGRVLWQLMRVPRLFGLAVIWLYQHTISPDHGPLARFFPYGYCRFYPSCSQYGADAVAEYGLVRGGVMALWRIIRCNPFSKGGFDGVKER